MKLKTILKTKWVTFFLLFIFLINLSSCSKGENDSNIEITDIDNDGIADNEDNCINISNTDQADIDDDGIGNLCDADIDNDSIANETDNCPENANSGQLDFNANTVGDLCDSHTYIRLHHPESIVKYNDYYLISNLGVELLPDTADGDGFISVINLNGTGLIQNHITGLNSPKGLEIINDLLYVCDLNVLKVFNIQTTEMVQSFSFQDEGVTLLNDVTKLYTDNETVFITATRTNRIFKLNITSGVKQELVVGGQTLLQTNGLELDNDNNVLYMVEFGEGNGNNARIIKIDLSDNNGTILGGGTTGTLYDGVVKSGNTLYVSDWSHRLFSLDLTNPNSQPVQLLNNLSGPADIYFDTDLNRIVIPNMTAHMFSSYNL